MKKRDPRYPSLVTNGDTAVSFDWLLKGMEVDCISRLINHGNTREITDERISTFLSGVLDAIIILGVHKKKSKKKYLDERESMFKDNFIAVKLSWKEEGLNEEQIKDKTIGWESASKAIILGEE